MKSIALRYGLYSGAVLIALGLLNWWFIAPMGYGISELFGYLSMIIALGAVPLAIRFFRDKQNQGLVSFKSGMQIGMGITLITSLIMGIYSSIFFIVAGDKFMEWYKSTLSTEEWEAVQAQMETMPDMYTNPWFQGSVMFFTVFLIGVIISLISSTVLKRQ